MTELSSQIGLVVDICFQLLKSGCAEERMSEFVCLQDELLRGLVERLELQLMGREERFKKALNLTEEKQERMKEYIERLELLLVEAQPYQVHAMSRERSCVKPNVVASCPSTTSVEELRMLRKKLEDQMNELTLNFYNFFPPLPPHSRSHPPSCLHMPSSSFKSKWPTSWFVVGALTLIAEIALKVSAWKYRRDFDILNIPGFVSFNALYVENRHSAFGMMRAVPDWVNKSLLFVSLLVLIGITIHLHRSKDSTAVLRRGIFCFIIGAAGNMVDRLSVGAVIDYVDIQLGPDGEWYSLAWNLSDIVINIGFAHVLLDAFLERGTKGEKKAVQAKQPKQQKSGKKEDDGVRRLSPRLRKAGKANM